LPGAAWPSIPPARWADRDGLVCGVGLVGGGGLWVGCWFENCIVDASIFVVKLSRADGGCLGTRSR
jgi:hypothetical protein